MTKEELKNALIREAKLKELPSMHDNWRFNFASQLKRLSNSKAYVLVTSDFPYMIEGCMIFQWKEKVIAFACRLSFSSSDENHRGYLTFDVMEEDLKNEKKLMSVYSRKYGAMRISDTTTFIITPEQSEILIEKYLS